MTQLALTIKTRHTQILIYKFVHAATSEKYMPPHLIFFALSLIVSSFTKMPFPLYGSGFRQARISAANCVMACLSGPSSNILVGWGTVAFTPFGTPSSTG